MPKISIIAPVYNVEKYIERCIQSIQNQTITDWEFILVDDCGEDQSMEVVRHYATQDSRIKYIESKENQGPMMAREKGYKKAQGEYLVFIDSDDTMPPTALECLYDAAVKYEADVVAGNILIVNTDGTRKIFFNRFENNEVYSKKEVCEKLLNKEYPHNLCGKMFNKDTCQFHLLKNYKHYTNGEDGYVFYQLLDYAERFVVIDKPVYDYWMHDTSSTHKRLTEQNVRGMVMCSQLQYEMFSKYLTDIDDVFDRRLYSQVGNISRLFGYKKSESIFKSYGFTLDCSLGHLLKIFPLKLALKTYLKIHL